MNFRLAQLFEFGDCFFDIINLELVILGFFFACEDIVCIVHFFYRIQKAMMIFRFLYILRIELF